MEMSAQFVGGLPPCLVAGKLQPHLPENLWSGLWPEAVRMGAFYHIKCG